MGEATAGLDASPPSPLEPSCERQHPKEDPQRPSYVDLTTQQLAKAAAEFIEMKAVRAGARGTFGPSNSGFQEHAKVLDLLLDVTHGGGWSSQDLVTLTGWYYLYICEPTLYPLKHMKWGNKSNQAVLRMLDRSGRATAPNSSSSR